MYLIFNHSIGSFGVCYPSLAAAVAAPNVPTRTPNRTIIPLSSSSELYWYHTGAMRCCMLFWCMHTRAVAIIYDCCNEELIRGGTTLVRIETEESKQKNRNSCTTIHSPPLSLPYCKLHPQPLIATFILSKLQLSERSERPGALQHNTFVDNYRPTPNTKASRIGQTTRANSGTCTKSPKSIETGTKSTAFTVVIQVLGSPSAGT